MRTVFVYPAVRLNIQQCCDREKCNGNDKTKVSNYKSVAGVNNSSNRLYRFSMGFKMNDSILYEYVLEEFEAQRITKSLWAKAIAHSGGNSDKTQSLYLQYRVDDLKQEFNIFAIDYSELTLADLSHYVDNLFVDDEWRKSKIADKEKHEEDIKNKLAQEEQEKKYGKIKGWLFPFSIFLGLWLIGAVIQSVYTHTMVLNDVEFLLFEGYAELVEQEFLLQLASLFIISWFSLVFYKKRKSAKDGAIVFFIASFIINAK